MRNQYVKSNYIKNDTGIQVLAVQEGRSWPMGRALLTDDINLLHSYKIHFRYKKAKFKKFM